MAEHLMRGARIDELAALGTAGRVQRLVEVELLGRRQAVRAEVAVVLDAQLDAHDTAGQRVTIDLRDLDARRERGDTQQDVGLARTELRQLVQRRIPDPDPRIDAADLDLPELRMIERPPRWKRSAVVLVLVPPRELDEILARHAVVVVDEL